MGLYLEDAITKEERKSYDLTEHQWSVAKNIIVSLLEAFDQVATTLSGEIYSTLSWCLSLLFGLWKAAKPDRMTMPFCLTSNNSSLIS